MLNARQQRIIIQVIDLYQTTAQPVGSLALSQCGKFRVSCPTLRNELAVLEEQGYLAKPHTSAGRVPTLKSYQWHLETIKTGKALNKKEKEVFTTLGMTGGDDYRYCRELAKQLAEISREGVFVAFSSYSTYYTGLTNLFTKPELHEESRTITLSQALDRLNDILENLMRQAPPPDKVAVIVGEESPFGKDFGALVVRFSRGEIKDGIIGILGLLRMDWEKNVGLMRYVREIINSPAARDLAKRDK